MKEFFRDALRILSLIVVDLFSYYVSLLLAVFTRIFILPFFLQEVPSFSFSIQYLASMFWVPLIFLFFINFQKLYFVRYPFWEETRILIKSLTVAFFFIFVTIYIRALYGNVLRSFFIFLWGISCFIFPFFRFWGKKLFFSIGIWKEHVMVIGSGETAKVTIQGLQKEKHLGYEPVGCLDDDPETVGKSIEVGKKKYKVYGQTDNFMKFIKKLDIDTVFIAGPYQNERLQHIINEVYRYVKRVIIVPEITGVSLYNSELHFLFMEKLFLIKVHNSLHSKSNMMIKRFTDLAICGIGFIFISPIMLLLVFLVKFSSKGKVFYGHERIGKDGKPFKALKFRTMYSDSAERLKEILENDPEARKEWEQNYKLKNDPRVTPIGKFLRKTSLDELPQIFNILKGEMALVGPRPVIQEEIEKFYQDYRDYYYSVTPGLTGLWQISGRSDTDYDFRVQTDVWYIQNWSLWLDLIIILQTPAEVVKSRGAY